MTVLTFQPEFVPLVRAGTKDRTLRATRKRPVRAGDALSLRRWTGRPYMTPQEVIRETTCVEVSPVTLTIIGNQFVVYVCDLPVHVSSSLDAFAALDGFRSADDMRAWFQRVHGLPFRGTMIRWRVA